MIPFSGGNGRLIPKFPKIFHLCKDGLLCPIKGHVLIKKQACGFRPPVFVMGGRENSLQLQEDTKIR
jgi:hypothetical protein